MRTLTSLALAVVMLGAIGTASAEPAAALVTAAAETVHMAPGDAAQTAGYATSSSTEPSEIDWPVVSGLEAEQGVAVQRADVLTPPKPPEPTLLVDINLSTQRMVVTEDGRTKYTWAVSSARAGYTTPTGTFRPTWKSAMWYSRQYDMAPMPHSVFFSGGAAIHATFLTQQLGTPASHGCVRLSPKNAATFYGMVGKNGMDRTRITVHGHPKYSTWNVASARQMNVRRYAALPYGYAPSGFYSQQYFRQAAPRAYYKPFQPRRTAKRAYRNAGFAYGYGY
jgi:lipoprotein-anchoring transpeptidase ErfK/SrfK